MTRLDGVALDDIQRKLGELEPGADIGFGLWWKDRASEQSLFESKTFFREQFLALHRLQRSKWLLSALQSALEADISCLKRKLLRPSRSHGLDQLPDEILAEILEIVLLSEAEDILEPAGCRSGNRRSNLQLVCRRFHCIVSSTPSLSALIDTRFPASYSEALIEQARDAPFYLKTMPPVGRMDLALINRIASRIKIMHVALRKSTSTLLLALYLTITCEPISFPSVTSLTLDDRRFGDAHTPFIQWSFPNLRSLCAIFGMPPTHFLSGLTELAILRSTCSLPALINALQFAPSVRHFKVEMPMSQGKLGILDRENPEGSPPAANALLFPKLESLDITFLFSCGPHNATFAAMTIFTGALSVAKLHSIRLGLVCANQACDGPGVENEHMDLFSSAPDPLHCVRDLSVRVLHKGLVADTGQLGGVARKASFRMDEYILKFIRRLPRLEKLHVRLSPVLEWYPDIDDFRNVRYLILDGLDSFDARLMRNIFERLQVGDLKMKVLSLMVDSRGSREDGRVFSAMSERTDKASLSPRFKD